MYVFKKHFYLKTIACNIILIVFFCGCSTSLNSYSTNTDNNIIEYLNKNKADIDNANSLNLKLLNSDINSHDIFLCGESHAVSENYAIQFELLKYLNQNAKVKYILVEFGTSHAGMINKYLTTGNELFLKKLLSAAKYSFSYTNEQYEFWRNVYKYNKTLPNDSKLVVIGIDIENDPTSVMWYLSSLIPKKDTPKELSYYVKEIKRYNNFFSKMDRKKALNYMIKENIIFKHFVIDLDYSIKSNENVYKKYLGNHYYYFKKAIENLTVGISAEEEDKIKNNSKGFYRIREFQMYTNMLDTLKHFKNGKYFGQFGDLHVQQANINCFTGMLKKYNKELSKKMLTLQYIYSNCMYLDKDSHKNIFLNDPIGNINFLKQTSKSNLTLYKLTGGKSPFDVNSFFISKYYNQTIPTTEYFQYIIFIKNAKACTAFDK